MHSFEVAASPWVDLLAVAYYWVALVAAEVKRYQEPTGKRHPRYRERRPPILTISWRVYYLRITTAVFTWAIAAMYYHLHGAALGWTDVLLLTYMFFALGNGPLEQVVSTVEGVFQMAVAVNLVLYLTIHTWTTGWLAIMIITFWGIFVIEWVRALKLAVWLGNRAPHRRRPTNHND